MADRRWVLSATFVTFAALSSPLFVLAQVPQERTVPLEETVQQEMAESRFHLGPVRLFPKFLLSNAGYDNNLFGTPPPTVSDWTANVSLGLHLLLPLGKKMYLRGDALPEYDWYAHHVDKRNFGGTYGGSWLAFFNHLSGVVSGDSVETVSRVSSEIETFATHKSLHGSAGVEVNLSSAWWIIAGGEGNRIRYSSEGAEDTIVKKLDRDAIAGRAGIRYRRSSSFSVVAEVEGTQASFARPEEAQRRDNRTTGYLLGTYYNRDRLFVNLSGGLREGRPYRGSLFPPFSTGTGSYFVSYFLTQPLEVKVYGHRIPQYSTTSQNAYYIETQNGVGMSFRIGNRLRLHANGQYGTNDYPIPVFAGETAVDRRDHYTNVGGGITMFLFRKAALTALVDQKKVSSNFPGVARTVLRFTTNLTLEGDVGR